MAEELTKEKVAELATQIRDMARLTYLPIGFTFLKSEDEMPEGARRPSGRGQAWPVCLAENIVRTLGWTIGMTLDDHFCIMAAAGMGYIEMPEYLQEGKFGSHHTKDKDLGLKLQNTLEACFLETESTAGLVLTPATKPMVMPQGVVFYGNPTQIGKIAKGVAWYQGAPVPASGGGIGACVVASYAMMVEQKPRIVLPCSGEKVLGHTEENDIFMSVPVKDLPDMVKGMKATDFMLPYPTAKFMFFEPRIPKGYPMDHKTYKAWKEGKKGEEKK